MSTAPPTRAPLRRSASITALVARITSTASRTVSRTRSRKRAIARLANDAGRGSRGIATLAKRSTRDAASSSIRLPSGVSSSWRCSGDCASACPSGESSRTRPPGSSKRGWLVPLVVAGAREAPHEPQKLPA
mgnify:CR=1 FL=1